ncbi:hypothetical protein CJ030_MR4G005816 [Morella rubra]|uniref:Purple acid phosphatase C-terminal domain-containing protein n=1 Tax=Morella rubra TaxID=262757 RepID=A0A6A1W0D5_9ROSI|nr:hypothetical protein CJ030_MR4G005816 [Morella rubra]
MKGTIHMVAGGGGCRAGSEPGPRVVPERSIYKDHDFGFVKLTAFNRPSLLLESKKSSDGKMRQLIEGNSFFGS